MAQNPRFGRSRYWDEERDRDYGRGRDNWREESRSYRSSRYADEGDHDRRQDRDYQGTLRAGDYGRYEEEEDRSYPERFQGGGRRSGGEYGEPDFGRRYGSESFGGYSGRSRESSSSDFGRGYGARDYGGMSSGRYGYGGGGGPVYYGSSSTGSGGDYDRRSGYGGGFGTYTSDYERKYGGGGRSDGGSGGRGEHDRNNRNRGERDWWDKATDEVSSWFGDEDAERRRQMDHRGRGPRNYRRSDDRIREDVSDRLTDDPLVDASEIDVSVQNQEVTLSGTVHTRRQKRLAEECAEEVSGVKHVQNNLRVKEPSWQSGSTGSGSSGSSTGASGSTAT